MLGMIYSSSVILVIRSIIYGDIVWLEAVNFLTMLIFRINVICTKYGYFSDLHLLTRQHTPLKTRIL